MFNIVNSICVMGMIFICFVVDKFIEDERGLYLSFAFCVLFFLTLIEGNRTGKLRRVACFMAITFNLIYMPIMFFLFNRFICVIPIYFVFGIVYTGILLDIKSAQYISLLELVTYAVILLYSYTRFDTVIHDISVSEIKMRYLAAIVGIVLAGSIAGGAVRYRYINYLKAQNIENEIRQKAMEAYVSKDMFLVNMSHDIRTPMNAIVGTSNLLLDQEVSEQVADSLYNIINSCNALLSITNELMDISKIERGETEIYSVNYDISELLLEVINMTTVRLTESTIRFFTDINKNIPKHLYGDSSKLRQVLVNLINNAIKYTNEGKIILRVDYNEIDEDKIELLFDVEDTGGGIRREEIGKIFDIRDENDFESENDVSTGISLNVCSEIIKRMNGQITVESEYQKGTTFTVRVPQKFIKNEPVASVYEDVNYHILVYEKDEEYGEHLKRMIDGLDIKCDLAKNEQDFERLISVNNYTHVFIANEKAEECKGFLDRRLNSEKIISLLDIDGSLEIDKASMVLNRPANILSVTSLLKNEMSSYVRDVMKKGRFTCKDATILVVDDNYTNLNVARAILEKYGASVITAASGREAINVLKDKDVNLVFLDYMMPEMNGIDTLEAIRQIPGSRFTALPVVALTANVISGAREMFLDAGFDEFMSKPIAIDKMERVLKRFLPKELIKYEESNI